MSRYDQIRSLIESNAEIAEFADFGEGISDECIERAEEALGFRLPESYKWWLRNFSGGEIGGEEIFSIYGEELGKFAGGDIVRMHKLQKNGDRIPLCHSDVDGVFSFDCAKIYSNSEYPVISEATGKVYASDFLEFLQKRIEIFQS